MSVEYPVGRSPSSRYPYPSGRRSPSASPDRPVPARRQRRSPSPPPAPAAASGSLSFFGQPLMDAYPRELGKGAFGTVSQISKRRVVKVSELYEPNTELFVDENMKEAIFLSTFRAPFLPELYSIRTNQKKNTLSLEMSYDGVSLQKYAFEPAPGTKLRIPQTPAMKAHLLPELMIQVARALVWMEQHCVAHTDIKPANLVIDPDTKELTVIDWGFVTPVFSKGRKYHGTPAYADPTYLGYKKTPTYDYDMLGAGLSLYYYLTLRLGLDQHRALTESQYYASLDLDRLRWQVAPIVGQEIWTLFVRMLEYDENARISAIELYESPALPDALREKYPLVKSKTERRYAFERVKSDRNPSLYHAVAWISDTLHTHDLHYLLGLTLSIFYRYYEREGDQLSDDSITISLCASLLIAMIILQPTYLKGGLIRVFSGQEIVEWVDGLFTLSELNRWVFEVLSSLDWSVYPTRCLADYNIVVRDEDLGEWGRVVTDPDFIGLSESEKAKRLEAYGFKTEKFKSHRVRGVRRSPPRSPPTRSPSP